MRDLHEELENWGLDSHIVYDMQAAEDFDLGIRYMELAMDGIQVRLLDRGVRADSERARVVVILADPSTHEQLCNELLLSLEGTCAYLHGMMRGLTIASRREENRS